MVYKGHYYVLLDHAKVGDDKRDLSSASLESLALLVYGSRKAHEHPLEGANPNPLVRGVIIYQYFDSSL